MSDSPDSRLDPAAGGGSPRGGAAGPGRLVDPRGPRFAAAITSAVLVVVLVLSPSAAAVWLLAAQTFLFVLAAGAGLRFSLYGALYRAVVRPRLGPPSEWEEESPPRFAQAVGAMFGLLGLVGYASSLTMLGDVAVALALAASFLNAAFAYCLGCEVYLLIRRMAGHDRGAEV